MNVNAEMLVERVLPRVSEVRVPPATPPQLLVVVDTEEEFDWSAPYSRSNTAVTAMADIYRVQALFDRYEVRPTYVVDYPVIVQDEGAGPLMDILGRRCCSIGAHLHPWVNPPYEETLSGRNSFTCNLPLPLQEAKLRTLTTEIHARFRISPQVFKAGRYGLGAGTVRLLDDLEYTVDASICPRMDFRAEDGPSFADFDAAPFFLTPSLLEVPCTVDFIGWSGPFGPAVHRLASRPALARFHSVGALARASVVNQIMLSPEGNSFDEMRALTKSLVQRGCRVFTMSFHSPSVAVGHTPYVQSDAQRTAFLDAIDRYLDFFISDLGGEPVTHTDFRATAARFATQL